MVSKLKRVLSSLLVCSMFSTFAATSVSADVLTIDYDSTVAGSSAKSYQSVSVELEKAEVYSVTLPKSVVLDGTEDSTSLNYNVTASGEISSVHYVRVIPLAGSKLYNEDETVSLDLNVTLDKHRWDNTEILTSSGSNATTGVMSVDSIEPGKWTGKIRFLVTLDDGGEWIAATCTKPATCIGYDTNDDGVLSEDEKLATPITKGTSLGHKFASESHAFPDTCERCKQMVYVISTAEQLTAFRDAVNNDGNTFAGATVELGADIDMSSESWTTGIGTYSNCFNGTFEGNGHIISNFNMSSTIGSISVDIGRGLFNNVGSSGTTGEIRNFILKDSCVEVTNPNTTSVNMCVGLIIGKAYKAQIIKNVHVFNSNVKVTVVGGGPSSTSPVAAAVFVGYTGASNTTISNCSAVGCNVYATGTNYNTNIYLGGAIGDSYNNKEFVNNSVFAVTCTVGAAKYYTTGSITNHSVGIGPVTVKNCIIDTTKNTDVVHIDGNVIAITYNNCLQGTTEECQSQAAVDILNTDNTETWVLDLENLNNGYPLIK